MEILTLETCALCPRRCHAERNANEGFGFCRMPSLPVLARAALHHWEEPPISGTRGAGTVFFSGCSLRCVYCQNERISQKNVGEPVTPARLRDIFEELISAGAHNIDLVNPTHFSHVLELVLEQPLPVPVIWNSGGYDRVETLRRLEGKIDVYLPDFKYPDREAAKHFSAAEDYPDVAKAAILEMVRQTGPYSLSKDGLLERGVLIRHLLLPGRLNEAKQGMDWVKEKFPPQSVLFSLMGQYVPQARAGEHPPLDRRLRRSELRAAVAYMQALELDGFTQEAASAQTDYIPAFDLHGVHAQY